MTTKCHPDVLDNGLNTLVNGTLSIAICQNEPVSISDCLNLQGSGGKRITTEGNFTGRGSLSDGINSISRQVAIEGTTFTDGVLVAVDGGIADLWVAVYSNDKVLFSSDEVTNVEMVLGSTVITPTINFGIQQ
jgi:hypothetical protein